MNPFNKRDGIKLRRQKQLERIGGFFWHELNDFTVRGRKRVIAVLEAHDRTCCEIQKKAPQLYDIARHIEIQSLLQRERAALEALQDKSKKIKSTWQERLV
jgi:hypothetical protein